MNDALCSSSPVWEGCRAPGLHPKVQVGCCSIHLQASSSFSPADCPEPEEELAPQAPEHPREESTSSGGELQTCWVRVGCLGSNK